MGSLWDTIKDQGVPARDLANDGIVVVEDPVRGAPVRVQRTEGLKFRPLDASSVDAIINNTQRAIEVISLDEAAKRSDAKITEIMASVRPIEDQAANVALEKQNYEFVYKKDIQTTTNLTFTADDFSDLVGDLSESEPAQKLGRPRKYANNAERQRAYRATKKPKTKRAKKK